MDWEATFRVVTAWTDRMERIMKISDRDKRKKSWDQHEQDEKVMKRAIVDERDQWNDDLLAGRVGGKTGERIGQILIGLLLPAVRKVGEAGERIDQTMRITRLVFSLAAYHADNKKYPTTLDALSPKYLAEIPSDLFSGKPLIYKPTETGYLLYSVGINEIDDGGKFYTDEDRGDDIGVRVPSVPKK